MVAATKSRLKILIKMFKGKALLEKYLEEKLLIIERATNCTPSNVLKNTIKENTKQEKINSSLPR